MGEEEGEEQRLPRDRKTRQVWQGEFSLWAQGRGRGPSGESLWRREGREQVRLFLEIAVDGRGSYSGGLRLWGVRTEQTQDKKAQDSLSVLAALRQVGVGVSLTDEDVVAEHGREGGGLLATV